MTQYYFLSIFIALILLLEMYFLGKYFTWKNKIFESNEPASFVLGAVIYFFITFVSFFFFLWIDISVTYFTVIFFIKEIFLIAFLILKREAFRNLKINFKSILFTSITIIIIPITFNNGLSKVLGMEIQSKQNVFQTYILIKEIFANILNTSVVFISRWTMSIISAAIVFNVVSSFIFSMSRRRQWLDNFLSLLFSFILLMTSNFGWSLDSQIGIYLLIFSVQMCSNILMRSRRRYAAIYGLIVIDVWFMDFRLFMGVSALGLIVAFIYTINQSPKASLFWVQLISPILIMASLSIYPYSSLVAFIVFILTFITYLFMISAED